MIVMPQQHRSRKTLPVCQWQLPVQDSLLYQAGYLEIDLQLDSGIMVHLHQSSENWEGGTQIKTYFIYSSILKKIPNSCKAKEIFENIRNHLW